MFSSSTHPEIVVSGFALSGCFPPSTLQSSSFFRRRTKGLAGQNLLDRWKCGIYLTLLISKEYDLSRHSVNLCKPHLASSSAPMEMPKGSDSPKQHHVFWTCSRRKRDMAETIFSIPCLPFRVRRILDNGLEALARCSWEPFSTL